MIVTPFKSPSHPIIRHVQISLSSHPQTCLCYVCSALSTVIRPRVSWQTAEPLCEADVSVQCVLCCDRCEREPASVRGCQVPARRCQCGRGLSRRCERLLCCGPCLRLVCEPSQTVNRCLEDVRWNLTGGGGEGRLILL